MAGFNICENCPPDIMHDELEGNFPHHFALLLQELLRQDLLDFDVINKRIKLAKTNNLSGVSLDLEAFGDIDFDRLRQGDKLRRRGTNLVLYISTV